MQIVINIPYGHYLSIKDGYLKDCIKATTEAIVNGIILPKGHGKLIDADDVKSYFSDREGDDFTAFHFYDAVESAQTIIEADKEQEDADND